MGGHCLQRGAAECGRRSWRSPVPPVGRSSWNTDWVSEGLSPGPATPGCDPQPPGSSRCRVRPCLWEWPARPPQLCGRVASQYLVPPEVAVLALSWPRSSLRAPFQEEEQLWVAPLLSLGPTHDVLAAVTAARSLISSQFCANVTFQGSPLRHRIYRQTALSTPSPPSGLLVSPPDTFCPHPQSALQGQACGGFLVRSSARVLQVQ